MLPIHIAMMAATTTEPVELADATVMHSVSSGTATAGIRVDTDGILYQVEGTVSTVNQNWLGTNTASNYEIRMVPTTGTLSSGSVNTWLAMTSSRTFTVSRSTIGSKSFVGILQIRLIGSTEILDTCTVDLTAENAA